MSTALERQAIAQVLQNYVTVQQPPIEVEWPNRAFEKPQGQPWIRFTVKDQRGLQIEMGSTNNTHRVYGSLILQVFVPADSGDGAALALGDALGELYRQKALNFADNSGHVRMRDPVLIPVGRDGGFWQTNVVIPFHRDDLP
jgi:hypothetical protein